MSSDSTVAPTVSARAGQPEQRRALARPQVRRRQGALLSQRAEARPVRARPLLLPDERAADFARFAAALLAELAPTGPLQTVLAERIAVAAWRLARADRLEAEALAFRMRHDGTSGIAVLRDGNGTRAVETMLRYRNAALAELMRCQRALQALQAEARAGAGTPAAPPARGRARPRPKDMPPKRALTAGAALGSRDRIADRSTAALPRERAPAAGPAAGAAPPPAPAPETRRTRESAPDQSLGPRPQRRSHADACARGRAAHPAAQRSHRGLAGGELAAAGAATPLPALAAPVPQAPSGWRWALRECIRPVIGVAFGPWP
jgi:hypothetical protein